MATTKLNRDKFEELRQKAEKLVQLQSGKNSHIPSDMAELIHELRVHQTELEIQNEELNRSQQEISELYYKYEDLYESAPNGYITLDSNGIISNINNSAVKMQGKSKTHLIGSHFTDFIDNSWIETFTSIQRKAGQTGEKQETELSLKRKAKPNIWVLINIIANRNSKSEVNYWKLTLVDITTRKNYEKELIEAKEKAKENDRLKTTFLANMSHEIRTPLNGIMGFAELLKLVNISRAKKSQFIDTIIQSGNHLLNIINDLIDISKIETGHIEIYNSSIQINEKLKSLKTFFKPETDKKGLKLSYHTPLRSQKATIITDNEKFHSIWINLIKNAIKYTNEGHVEFGYELENNQLKCYVEDTGIGISEKDKATIFDQFVQVKQRTLKSQEGTGLGLSIAKAYIELLGGQMSLDSEKDKGSRFSFTIPYKPSENNKNIETPDADGTVYLNGKKIIIVEDDLASHEYLKEILLPTQATIITTETGQQGIKEIQTQTDYDLALIDIGLPDISGLEVIKQIKQINNKILVIAQTAYAMNENRIQCINAGADDYIAKPINKMKFLQMIKKHINN